jgi:predicted N-formylglutamate amidohydrolase
VSQHQPAFNVLRKRGTSAFVLVCDHASHHIPPELHDLGLPAGELRRHIAWDIGAAGTPSLGGVWRPWTIALSSHQDRRLAEPVLAALRRQAGIDDEGRSVVGDNEPYDLDPDVDYTTPFHAIRRGLPHLQVEFRQDQIATADTQRDWAERFGRALVAAVPSTMAG